jgi:hypothetical protein
VVKNIFFLVGGVVVGIAQPGLNLTGLIGDRVKIRASDMKGD